MKQTILLRSFLLILLIGSVQIFAQEGPVPVLHYSFEGNLLDDSGNGNDALARGSSGVPAYGETDGLKGKYLDLSANANNNAAGLFFISTPDSILSSSDAPFTITGWTKIVTDSLRMQIVNQPAVAGASTQFYRHLATSSGFWYNWL